MRPATNLLAYLTAWSLAEGDEERLEEISSTEVMVWNTPRRSSRLPHQDRDLRVRSRYPRAPRRVVPPAKGATS